jgi:hypothetical protein
MFLMLKLCGKKGEESIVNHFLLKIMRERIFVYNLRKSRRSKSANYNSERCWSGLLRIDKARESFFIFDFVLRFQRHLLVVE